MIMVATRRKQGTTGLRSALRRSDFVSPRLQLAFDALDPERMPERHRFASRPVVKLTILELARALCDSMRIESLSRAFVSFLQNRLFAASEHSPASGA